MGRQNVIGKFKQRKILRYATFSMLFSLLSIALPMHGYAATTQLYLNPSTPSVLVGSTFTTSIRLNAGTAVDAVEVTLSYNPAYIQYVSTDTTSSAFPVSIISQTNSSSTYLARGTFAEGGVNADSLVATVTLKAIAPVASTPLGLTGNATFSGDYINPTSSGGTVTITADKTAPVVKIKNPLGSAQSSTSFDVVASATDNVKVTRMEVYIDNKLTYSVRSDSINPYTWNVQPDSISKGKHTITVKAYDAANNLGISYVTVSKM